MDLSSLAPVRKVKWGAVLGGVVFAAGLIVNAAQSGLKIPSWLLAGATYVTFFGTAWATRPEGDITRWPVHQLDELGAAVYHHVDGVDVTTAPTEDLNVMDAHG